MTGTSEATTFVELDRSECYELVASATIGRLAVSHDGAAPVVVPVNYVLDGHDIVFLTGPGPSLRSLHVAPVSFQVDQVDPMHRTGWSVLLRGIARLATDEETRHLVIERWTQSDEHHWIRIVTAEITGRSMCLPDVAWETHERP